MKSWLLYGALLTGVPVLGLLTKVRDRNLAVEAGRAAYASGDATGAAKAFAAAWAAKARRNPDPHLLLNLGHAQARAGQPAAARRSYEQLLAGSPPAVGSVARQQLAVLAARQGQLAQALGLLRQALILNPANRGARYDYEVLSAYLARQQAPAPPPGGGRAPAATPTKGATKAPQEKEAASRAGTDRPGQLDQPAPGNQPPDAPPQSRPDPAGQPDPERPGTGAGNKALDSRGPGTGREEPMPSGRRPGTQRGLDRSGAAGPPAAAGSSTAAGTEAAEPEDVRMQTQRERLKAMNLSPAQARQLLEALRAQEQQYLQQLTRPAPRKPDPGKPSW